MAEKKEQAVKKRKSPRYSSFKLQKKIPHPKGSPIRIRPLLDKTFRLLWDTKRTLIGLIIIYAILNTIFVQGFNLPIDIQDYRDSVTEVTAENEGDILLKGAVGIGTVLQAATNTDSEAAALYQGFFTVLFSLAIVWVFRMYTAKNTFTSKMALYRSTYPLVPTLVVLTIIGFQMLPAVIGTSLYSIVLEVGAAVNGYEHAVWILFVSLLCVLSLYMISSSLFALYIVTLPEAEPIRSLRSARALVHHRRFAVMGRVILLPVLMLLLLTGIMLPLLFFVSNVAPWVFFGLSMLALPFAHAYLYSLYRELL